MKYIKKLEVYSPKEKLFGDDIVYLTDGQSDWYQLQHDFQANTMKVMFEDDGLITACSKDVSALFPVGCGVAEINTNKTDLLGLYFIDGQLVDMPRPSELHQWNSSRWVIPNNKLTEFLTKRKAELLIVIANKTDLFKAQYLQGYSQAEIDSFYRQEREARGELPLMLLTELFEGRDDLHSVEELKEKVIEKADIFAIIMGKLFAIKQNFEKHIENAKTMEELDNIEQEINKWQKL